MCTLFGWLNYQKKRKYIECIEQGEEKIQLYEEKAQQDEEKMAKDKLEIEAWQGRYKDSMAKLRAIQERDSKGSGKRKRSRLLWA